MKKFVRNLFFAFAAQGTSMILSVFISLILPKVLGVEQFAYWQLFIFYSGYVGIFHFGLSDGLYLRYGGTSVDKMDKSLIGSQFKLMILWQLVISTFVLCVIPFVITDGDRSFVWIMTALYLVIANATWCLGYIFQAANETKIYSTGMIISKGAFIVVLLISFVLRLYDFKFYIVLYVAAQGLACIYSIIKGWMFVTAKFLPLKVTWHEMLANMKIGINLTFSNIASSLILGLARGFVDVHWSIASFGVFSLAISLVNFILQFINQVSMVMFPALRQINNDKQITIYVMMRDTLGIFLCGVLIIYVPMKQVLGWWLPDYADSLSYLGILLPICVFDGKMAMLYNTYMKVMRRERILLAINSISCGLSLGLCFLLTLFYDDVTMAIIAVIVAIITRSLVSSIYLSKSMGVGMEKNIYIELVLSAIFIICNVSFSTWSAFGIYVGVYAVVMILKRKELVSLLQIVCSKGKILKS